MKAKLNARQIAAVRAWWLDRQAILKRLGGVNVKAEQLGVTHALVSLICRDPTYRPSDPALVESIRQERQRAGDFLVVPHL